MRSKFRAELLARSVAIIGALFVAVAIPTGAYASVAGTVVFCRARDPTTTTVAGEIRRS